VVASDGDEAFDLTAAKPELDSFLDLATAASVADEDIDDVAGRLLDRADPVSLPADTAAGLPVVPDEVWAAGVTYAISEQAREEESDMPDVYLRVHRAERPELFFKATPSRTVGPGEAVGVRGDSTWDVPEPELGIVLYRGSVVGYTVGNDVSSRSIEGENPLYLPQAKVYDRCCAVGPCVVSPSSVGDPHDLEMSMTIERDGDVVYDDATSTSELVRSVEELVSYAQRHDAVPELSVLLTGTSLVPEEGFTLRESDVVSIDIENVGVLENPVVQV
jgi:2-dehydro-3-deoxy-D-arabinonate dehydratase